jgi:16S rRNA (uracil1498-N3)-methyltransferase
MHSFFAEHISHQIISLNEEESMHASRVLRLQSGDKIILLDGKGSRAEAIIQEPHHKKCTVQVSADVYHEEKPSQALHIAMAPTKNIDRFEWFLEKATEIGISRITPLLTSNSERKVINTERLHKILLAAMKQSQRLYLPSLDELTPIRNFLEMTDLSAQRMIAHCEESEKLFYTQEINQQQSLCLLIGPEGDFSTTEIEQAINKGFKPVSLGKARLRTETAGVYAVSLYNS